MQLLYESNLPLIKKFIKPFAAYEPMDEDLNAEFVHIRDGVCVRAYLEYEGEVDTDEGEDPETAVSEWSEVAGYLDEHMV